MKRRIFLASFGVAAVAVLAISLVFVSGVASAHASVPKQASVPLRIYHGVPRIRANGTAESTNWSAYAVTGSDGAYTSVSGSWVEPTVTCSSTAYAAFWVGLDGYSSDSVEQLGTDSDCVGKTPSYYGWWEMYPNPSEDLSTSSYPVSAGDTLTATVTFSGTDSYTLTMSSSRGWKFTTTQTGSYDRSSAEWIAEAPSECSRTCKVLPLSDFGTVNFSNSTANGDTIGSYGSSVWEEITMVTSSGTVKAQPSALNSSGNGFSVTWHHD